MIEYSRERLTWWEFTKRALIILPLWGALFALIQVVLMHGVPFIAGKVGALHPVIVFYEAHPRVIRWAAYLVAFVATASLFDRLAKRLGIRETA